MTATIPGQLDLLDLLTETTTPVPITPRLTECPWCGERVAGHPDWWISTNHGQWGDDTCVSMRLTLNHVAFDVAALARLTDHDAADCADWTGQWLCPLHSGSTESQADVPALRARHLTDARRYYTRAAHVWRNHLDQLHTHLAPHLARAGLTPTDLKDPA